MSLNSDNINNVRNKEIFYKNIIELGNKTSSKLPVYIPNLITNNNNPNLDNNDNNLNPPKKVKKKCKVIAINNYLNRSESSNKINNINNKLSQKELIIQKTQKIMEYNDAELNQLEYNLALKYDKRTFFEYYFSLIKTKHNLIFSFFYHNDYNSRIIKIDLFFINFVIYFAVNALFFNDDTMHKIYNDKGKFDFTYQIPIIIYSTIISSILNSFLKSLALSEDSILNLKKNKIDENLDKKNMELNKKLKIMFLLFFIIDTILLLFFWYYISMFCAIYKNTQIHLIKDTSISFAASLLYPFGIYLLPGLLRIHSLMDKQNKREYLFKISKLAQMI